MNINNKEFSKKEILRRIGSIQQIAGTQKYVLEEGKGKGTSLIRVRNGTGLDFHLIADKCLDIFDVSYQGHQLAWISNNQLVANHHYESEGNAWLRSFNGGMLVTCGLRNVGPPDQDETGTFGLHGRISATPAKNVSIREYWDNDIFHMEISGEVRESSVFGENLVIYRTVHILGGVPTIHIHDKIVNEGFDKQQLMLLYHINWGFPLLSEKTELIMEALNTHQRGKKQAATDAWQSFEEPVHAYKEKVFFHELKPDNNNRVSYRLINSDIQIGVKVSWDNTQLPWLTQWKMTGESEYVLGLEPGNTLPLGRTAIRESGKAEFLESFQEKDVHLQIDFEKL